MKKISLFLTESIGYPNKGDTNLLIKESVLRFDTYAFTTTDLILKNLPELKLIAKAKKVSIDENGVLKASAETKEIEIDKNCIVTIRLNPPFDSRYSTAMHLLAYKENEAFIANLPSSILKMPEKLVSPELTKFMPETIITEDIEEIQKFWKEHEDIVIKPLYEFGGRGVFRLQKEEENYKSIFKLVSEKYNEPLVAQKYIPEVKQGDKRVVLFNGDYYNCLNRVPPEGQIQAAIISGGSFEKSELTEREKEICKILKPICKKNGVYICGFDTIGDYLTEVNVTCPAGMYLFNELYEPKSEKDYWNMIEKELVNPSDFFILAKASIQP